MFLYPLAKCGLHDRYYLKPPTSELAFHTLRKELAPQRSALVVVHHERVRDQFSGNTKCVFLAVNRPDIPNAGKAKRSPRDGYENPSNDVVDHFPTTQKR